MKTAKQRNSETRIRLFCKYSLVFIILSSILSSCQDETIFLDKSQNLSQITENGTIINGRFFFTSKESLEQQIQKFEKEDISIVENKFERF